MADLSQTEPDTYPYAKISRTDSGAYWRVEIVEKPKEPGDWIRLSASEDYFSYLWTAKRGAKKKLKRAVKLKAQQKEGPYYVR